MRRINSVQLVLEGMRKEISALPQFDDLEELGAHYRQMENYLRIILSEFERWSGSKNGQEKKKGPKSDYKNEFLQLEHLDEFTANYQEDGGFAISFSERYRQILQLLGQELRGADLETAKLTESSAAVVQQSAVEEI